MITIAHLMDDFGMGGVTRALTLFEEPMIKRKARSHVVPVHPNAQLAPRLDADLIVDHAALSWARLPFLISLRARNPKARIVHVEHSYTRAFEQVQVRAKGRFRRLLRICAGLFDTILCVSDAQRNWLFSEVGIALAKLRVIYPWTDRTDLFTVPVAKPRAERPLKLLAYGRYAGVKNFGELVRAMRSFNPSEVELTLFGDGPDRANLEALTADLPHVEVHGPCADPAPYFEACDAVIIPSRFEAFGLVATEARMAARAVIVADVDGLPEQASVGGRIAPMGGAYEIAQVVRWAIKADLPHLGMAARMGVKSQHTTILRRWTQLIERVETARYRREAGERAAQLGGVVA
ncbi:MAG: glycosyltransferase family 4 protein [Pseudomonadota bacterium]